MTENKSCERKVAHPSRKAARMAARILHRKGEIGANAYLCDNCGKWHVGIAGAIARIRIQRQQSRRQRQSGKRQKPRRQRRQPAWQ